MPQLCSRVTEAKPVSQRYAEPEYGGAIDRHCTPAPRRACTCPGIRSPSSPSATTKKNKRKTPKNTRKSQKIVLSSNVNSGYSEFQFTSSRSRRSSTSVKLRNVYLKAFEVIPVFIVRVELRSLFLIITYSRQGRDICCAQMLDSPLQTRACSELVHNKGGSAGCLVSVFLF